MVPPVKRAIALDAPHLQRQVKLKTAVGRPKERNSIFARAWRAFARAATGKPNLPVFAHDVISAPLPEGVNAEIINICNADCSFCGYGKGEDGKAADPRVKRKLDPAVFRHLLKIFNESGGGRFSLTPILGEVTAHPDWLKMVREARLWPNVKEVNCFTNAILLDRFGSKEVLTSGLTHMSVSTSLGGREQYKRLYGVDKFDVVVKNVLDLLRTNKELGLPVEIDLMLRMDKPFDDFFASPLYAELTLLIDAKRVHMLDDNWDDFRGIIGQEGIPKGHTFKDQYADKSTPCYALFRQLEVLGDGTIQGCTCRVEPELWGGNIKKYDSLFEAWKDPGLERLRENWFNGTLSECCKGCSHYIPYTNLARGGAPKAVFRSALGRLRRAVLSKA